ncbi:hypothetical protein K2X33_07220 [bacterium]|nr:hypothetical protein [bacterium]
MKQFLFAVAALLSVSAWSGDGPGNNGDPDQSTVYSHARFGLEKCALSGALSDELLDVLEKAVSGLIVEPDPALAIVAEVRPDPKWGGKRVVYVNFKELRAARNEGTDLTAWAIHEAFQTIINEKTKLAYDLGEEHTKNLRFDEAEYLRWYRRQPGNARQRVAGPTPGEFPLLPGFYESYNDEFSILQIQFEEESGRYIFNSPKFRQKDSIGEYIEGGYGPYEVRLKHQLNENGKAVYTLLDQVYYRHTNGCVFRYELEVIPTIDGFRFSELLPATSIKRNSGCELVRQQWRTHHSNYVLRPSNLGTAYEAWAKRALNSKERATARLFGALFDGDPKTVSEALADGADPKQVDWKGRLPIHQLARYGRWQFGDQLLDISPLEGVAELALSGGKYSSTSELDLKKAYAFVGEVFTRKAPTQRDAALALEWLSGKLDENLPDAMDSLEKWEGLAEPGTARDKAFYNLSSALFAYPDNTRLKKLLLHMLEKPLGHESKERLIRMAIASKTDFLWELLKHVPDIREKSAEYSVELLWEAGYNKQFEVGNRLITDYGLDPATRNPKGLNTLGKFIFYGAWDAIEWIAGVAAVNDRMGENLETPLVFAARRYREKVKARATTTELAAAITKIANVRGIDLNLTDKHGYTALDYLGDAVRYYTGERSRHPENPLEQAAIGVYLTLKNLGATHAAAKAPSDWNLYGTLPTGSMQSPMPAYSSPPVNRGGFRRR